MTRSCGFVAYPEEKEMSVLMTGNNGNLLKLSGASSEVTHPCPPFHRDWESKHYLPNCLNVCVQGDVSKVLEISLGWYILHLKGQVNNL